MAVAVQGVDITPKIFPFTQQISFNATRYTQVPWGQAIIDETFQTNAIGAGDSGLLQLDIALPSDYVCMLRDLHMNVVDTANINWDLATFGLAVQTPGGPYKTSVTDFPEDEYSWYQLYEDTVTIPDRFGTNRVITVWGWGGDYPGGAGSQVIPNQPSNVPLWIPPGSDASFVQRQCLIFIRNPQASQPAQQFTIRAFFDLFTFEQAYSAGVMSSPRVFS